MALIRKTICIFALAAAAVAAVPSHASHSQYSGKVLLSAVKVHTSNVDGRSYCGSVPTPGYEVHQKDLGVAFEVCLPKPVGSTGIDLAYTPVYPGAQVHCLERPDEIVVFGRKGQVSPPFLIPPTVMQPFTITWKEQTEVNWSPCTTSPE